MALRAFYLDTPKGRRFCLFMGSRLAGPVRGTILYVPPFAEEMNKSRRMAADQARAFAEQGYAVLQMDLLGTGDSEGDFGDATWGNWQEDLLLACRWLEQTVPEGERWLWGLRTGGLLATTVAGRLSTPVNLLLWQPTLSGKQFLQQFLRLKMAGEMLSGEGKGKTDGLREQLRQGQSIEVAGYGLSPAMAAELELADIALPGNVVRVEWLELSPRADSGLSPAAALRLEKWQASNAAVRSKVVTGPAFWQTTEIETCPALRDASLQALVTEAYA
ncbi:alpha/beta hydrolase family protein [Chitinimonas naiadis]